MEAPRLHDDRTAFECSGDEFPLVARHARLREARDVSIEDSQGVGDLVGEKPEPRAEDDRDPGLPRSQLLADGVQRRANTHNRMPASVAERKLASVPAIMARNPSRARSCLRSGASAPIPPIWMPTELRFANPQSANVAMVNETGSRLAFNGPRCAYAMNSLITIRSPRSPPTTPLSCHGTPITQAIGRKIHPRTVCRVAGNHEKSTCRPRSVNSIP